MLDSDKMISTKLKRRIYLTLLIVIGVFLGYQLFLKSSEVNHPYHDQFITVLESSDPDGIVPYDSNELRNLLNLTNFNYTLQPDHCSEQHLGILIITSYAGHDELRSAHRQAMPATKLAAFGLRRIFLLATLPPTERYITQAALQAEHSRFGDLLQGNFMEAYRNLTYKHTMGLRWAAVNCAAAQFIVKSDDDTVFDVYKLHGFLFDMLDTDHPGSAEFLAGFVLDAPKAIRTRASKWYVTPEEFAGTAYPDFLSGWLYVTNKPTADRLLERAHAERHRWLWIDDAWVTGVLREPLRIPLVRMNRWFSANAEFLDCCIEDLRRWRVRCDYWVGPNGGDGRLLVAFGEAVEQCYKVDDDAGDGDDGCAERRPEQSLALTCVAKSKHVVADHGRPYVEAVRL